MIRIANSYSGYSTFLTHLKQWSVPHARRGRERRNSGGGGCYYNLQQHFPDVLFLHALILLSFLIIPPPSPPSYRLRSKLPLF